MVIYSMKCHWLQELLLWQKKFYFQNVNFFINIQLSNGQDQPKYFPNPCSRLISYANTLMYLIAFLFRPFLSWTSMCCFKILPCRANACKDQRQYRWLWVDIKKNTAIFFIPKSDNFLEHSWEDLWHAFWGCHQERRSWGR